MTPQVMSRSFCQFLEAGDENWSPLEIDKPASLVMGFITSLTLYRYEDQKMNAMGLARQWGVSLPEFWLDKWELLSVDWFQKKLEEKACSVDFESCSDQVPSSNKLLSDSSNFPPFQIHWSKGPVHHGMVHLPGLWMCFFTPGQGKHPGESSTRDVKSLEAKNTYQWIGWGKSSQETRGTFPSRSWDFPALGWIWRKTSYETSPQSPRLFAPGPVLGRTCDLSQTWMFIVDLYNLLIINIYIYIMYSSCLKTVTRNVADEKESRLWQQPNQLLDHKFMANPTLDAADKKRNTFVVRIRCSSVWTLTIAVGESHSWHINKPFISRLAYNYGL